MSNNGMMLRGTLGNGEARFFAVDSTDMLKYAKKIHGTSLTASAALGRLISAASMIGANLKNKDDRATISINGRGYGGALVATAYQNGLVKAYVTKPKVELPLKANNKFDIASFTGTDGRISIMRSNKTGKPYVGQCELQSGEIADDLAHYYLQSQQIPSLVALGVLMDKGEVKKSGGIIIQAMPGCSDELLSALEVRSMIMSDISTQLVYMTISEFTEAIFDRLDMKISQETYPTYGCDCSNERIEEILLSMGVEELKDMIKKDGGANLSCHFCLKEYRFNVDEINNLIKMG